MNFAKHNFIYFFIYLLECIINAPKCLKQKHCEAVIWFNMLHFVKFPILKTVKSLDLLLPLSFPPNITVLSSLQVIVIIFNIE